MISVAFVCLGNICRSPMAELIFKKLVEERGLSSSFNISSFGTSDCEEGNSVYPPAKRALDRHNIPGEHIAKQISKRDILNNDYILVMDTNNLFDVLSIAGNSCSEKIFKLRAFTGDNSDIADPWYTLNFEKSYKEIEEGCIKFLEYLLKEKKEAFAYDKRH
ncbi:MAG: low molecular weight phosphotyrosine protein phosphatase [Clostridiales bacterium]|nr:low molecular weight phosphotyrosine protein phosphatase [Clostridiales bacterium]